MGIPFCLQILFCLICFLGLEDNKIFTSGVTEDYVDRTKVFKTFTIPVSLPFDSLDNHSYNNLRDLFVRS